MADSAEGKQAPHLFKKGQSGNPKGRPKGSRNKLTESFLTALYNDWQGHGEEAIVQCREEKPTEYVKIVAGLLPKEMILQKPEEEMSDSELQEMLDVLKSADFQQLVANAFAVESGDEATHGGTGTPQ